MSHQYFFSCYAFVFLNSKINIFKTILEFTQNYVERKNNYQGCDNQPMVWQLLWQPTKDMTTNQWYDNQYDNQQRI